MVTFACRIKNNRIRIRQLSVCALLDGSMLLTHQNKEFRMGSSCAGTQYPLDIDFVRTEVER